MTTIYFTLDLLIKLVKIICFLSSAFISLRILKISLRWFFPLFKEIAYEYKINTTFWHWVDHGKKQTTCRLREVSFAIKHFEICLMQRLLSGIADIKPVILYMNLLFFGFLYTRTIVSGIAYKSTFVSNPFIELYPEEWGQITYSILDKSESSNNVQSRRIMWTCVKGDKLIIMSWIRNSLHSVILSHSTWHFHWHC